MLGRHPHHARWIALLSLGLLVLAASPLAWGADLQAARAQLDTTTAAEPVTPAPDPAIEAIWRASDGAGGQAPVWGAAPLAVAVERYRESSSGQRTMVYFAKGRLDILDPARAATDPWYVSGALLVTEMLSGQIQFGEREWVRREPAQIPIVGDPADPNALTYATLAQLATLGGPAGARGGTLGPTEANDGGSAALRRVNQPITALVNGKGTVDPAGVMDAAVRVGAYDAGHNVAAPFVDWAAQQAQPSVYLLGRPLTEPYWLDVTIGGQARRVLLQAFERRVLTYTPSNPAGWQVESADVGLHYRAWRGLAQPSDPSLIPLASGVPFGEELVAAATANLIDPYLFAALAQTASGGDPRATQANGGAGLLGVRPEVAAWLNPPVETPAPQDAIQRQRAQLLRGGGHRPLPQTTSDLADPQRNAGYAAIELGKWLPQSLDWRGILANYYSGGNPNWNDPALNAFVDGTLAVYADLLTRFPRATDITVPSESGAYLGAGRAAYYSPSYDRAWWERTLRLYESWGQATSGWQDDPNGYYCVRPGYTVGMRLLLVANGTSIVCTIGDTVAQPHLASWRANWVVELSWSAFTALGLEANNTVEVYHVGLGTPPAMPDPPAVEPATPPADQPPATEPPAATPTPEAPPVEATPTPIEPATPPAASPTVSPAPTEPPPTVSPAPTNPPSPTSSPTPSSTPSLSPSPTTTPTSTPTPEPAASPTPGSREPGALVGAGAATLAAGPGSTEWWEASLVSLANAGQAVDGWARDPLGYYCVNPDYLPGERLRVTANGVTIDCAIGATVSPEQVDAWRAQWSLELNDAAWNALLLDSSSPATSVVEVYYLSL